MSLCRRLPLVGPPMSSGARALCCRRALISARSFHSLPPLLKGRTTEAATKRRDRTRRLSARRQQLRLEAQNAAPDPVLGYRSGNEAYWRESELCKLILDREEVWGISQASATSTVSAPELSSGLDGASGAAARLESSPALLNFGLTEDDRRLLEDDVGAVELQADQAQSAATREVGGSTVATTAGRSGSAGEPGAAATATQAAATLEAAREEQRDQLLRIIDLRNGDSGAIRGATARRIFQAFGSDQAAPDRFDTGRAEVQSAFAGVGVGADRGQSPYSPRAFAPCSTTSSSIPKSSSASER